MPATDSCPAGLADDRVERSPRKGASAAHLVLRGTPTWRVTRTLAETVVTGDPSFAGPLAGVPLGLRVVHIFEPAIRPQIPLDVFGAQVALLMELSLDAPGIVAALSAVRESGAPEPP